jgi:DNA-binding GntR family transcriptional regulator
MTKTQKDSDNLARRLEHAIIMGNYRPGEWLKQADLENTYNANRFETRMALSDLAARKIIDHIPNRGYRVINPTANERENLYEVRTILETAAAKLAAQKATEEDISKLQMLVDQFNDAIENKPKEYLGELNVQFHTTFYALSANPLLCQQISDMRHRGLPGRQGGWDTIAGMRASNEDHSTMVEMLRRKDAEGLSYCVYRHLNRWREFSTPTEA